MKKVPAKTEGLSGTILNECKPVLFGKFKGVTFKELFEKHGDYARWYHETTK